MTYHPCFLKIGARTISTRQVNEWMWVHEMAAFAFEVCEYCGLAKTAKWHRKYLR